MPNTFQTMLGLLHLVLWIIAVVDIVKSSRSILSKILWILVVLLLPLFGLILYYVFGRGK